MTVGSMDFSAGLTFGGAPDCGSAGHDGLGTGEPIAVIGAAGRFPMADDLSEYWENLRHGRNTHRPFPAARAQDCRASQRAVSYPAGYLDDIAGFDHAFFEISFREACLMDPNQRIFLEEAYRSLESAGYTGSALRDFDTGVYVGHSADLTADYADLVRDEHPKVFPEISVAGSRTRFPKKVFSLQIEGSKTGLQMPGIVDEVVTLAEIKAEDGSSYRAFVTHTLNPFGFPAKDRSGRLDLLEPPDLGALIAKCAATAASTPATAFATSKE